MEHEYSMVITACGDRASARTVAERLIEARLAACVQMLPAESMYTWQGELCRENEVLLLIKTKTALFDEIVSAIMETHTYNLPEIIRIPVTGGLPEYLDWIDGCTEQ